MISFFNESVKFELKDKRMVKKWLKQIIVEKGRSVRNLNYIFCSDKYLLEINKRYLGHDYYTDIITFDTSEECSSGKISGDIFISIDTVMENGNLYGEGFERELFRVMAHGLLHLSGFDDGTEDDRKKMTEAENKALDVLYGMKVSS